MAAELDLITQLTQDANLQAKIQTLSERTGRITQATYAADELVTDDLPAGDLAFLLELAINGRVELSEQKVVVEYLRNDQRLKIPAPLGMMVGGGGICPNHDRIVGRYRRVCTMTYAQIRAQTIRVPQATPQAIAEHVDNLQVPPGDLVVPDWGAKTWYTLEDGTAESEEYVDIVFSKFSGALQFNCDVRDFGVLNSVGMTVTDDAWKDIENLPKDRLRSKMYTYSLQCIAALNYTSVGNHAKAAWSRAYGLSIGLLPASTSQCTKEYIFVHTFPARDDRTAVLRDMSNYELPMINLCCNILAMFGLFHLNKDHTFRTGDTNMARIGTSYIKTLRTLTTETVIESLANNMEATVRTAAHPFGLAQTYWLAQVMHKHNLLAAPLMIRYDVTPPPVQRLMICNAAMREWGAMPIGKILDQLHENDAIILREEIKNVLKNPPAYSSLYKLYGEQAQAQISEQAERVIASMMPMVYGFTMAVHVRDERDRDGLGHSLSLENVARDSKGVASMWKSNWEKYMEESDQAGLMNMITMVYGPLQGAGATPAQQAPPG